MARRHRFNSPALRYAYDKYVGDDPVKQAAYEESLANAEVARRLYDLRTKARLSQAELAKRVGTARSVISRLEDAEYEGHSLAMLRRVASSEDRPGRVILPTGADAASRLALEVSHPEWLVRRWISDFGESAARAALEADEADAPIDLLADPRLGTVDECAALCATFLDGTSRFVTGQFVAHDGGWV